MTNQEQQQRVMAELERLAIDGIKALDPARKLKKRASAEEWSVAIDEVVRRAKQFEEDALRLAFLAGCKEAVRYANTARNIRAALTRQQEMEHADNHHD